MNDEEETTFLEDCLETIFFYWCKWRGRPLVCPDPEAARQAAEAEAKMPALIEETQTEPEEEEEEDFGPPPF